VGVVFASGAGDELEADVKPVQVPSVQKQPSASHGLTPRLGTAGEVLREQK